jgi:DHA1 family inner membrane transport protein
MSSLVIGSTQASIVLMALFVGAFAIGMDMFVVIGLLSNIASGLQISPSKAGWLISIYALFYAVLAPVCAYLFQTVDRRLVMLASIGLFAAGNIVCGISQNYAHMSLGRIISALGAAAFTPLATSLAFRLVPEKRSGTALAVVFGGMTLAQAVGVPTATFIGQTFDWRWAFYFIAALGIAAFFSLFFLLDPLTPNQPRTSKQSPRAILTRGTIGLLSVTFLVVLSEFIIYTYISVILGGTLYAGTAVLPIVLLGYGTGSILGNVATGLLTDRIGPTRVLLGSITLQTILLVLLVEFRDIGVAAIIIGFAWGIVSYMYLVPIQHRLLARSGEGGSFVLSINSSLIYLGISTGGFIGSLILAGYSLDTLSIATAGFGTASIVVAAIFMWKQLD